MGRTDEGVKENKEAVLHKEGTGSHTLKVHPERLKLCTWTLATGCHIIKKMEDREYNQRTIRQNRALHLYFQLIANALNDAGLDMRVVLKPEIQIPWSKDSVKEYLWRPIQQMQLQKKSTTLLTTKDIDAVYDTLNLFLSEKHGISEPFPSIEEIMNRQLEEK